MVRGAYGGLKMVLSQGHCPPSPSSPFLFRGLGDQCRLWGTYNILCSMHDNAGGMGSVRQYGTEANRFFGIERKQHKRPR